MTLRQFYDWQTAGGAGDVSTLVRILEEHAVPWCMIGGLAVNHWAEEPMATADVDLVIATDRLDSCLAALAAAGFTATPFEWSVNLKGRSTVSIQISTEDFYKTDPERAVPADVHGILMRVASLEDTLRGKLKAWTEPGGGLRPPHASGSSPDSPEISDAHRATLQSVSQRVAQTLKWLGSVGF